MTYSELVDHMTYLHYRAIIKYKNMNISCFKMSEC